MTDSEEIFLRESIAHSRELKPGEASRFLRGMLMACGAIELPVDLIRLIRTFIETDEQLELIASDQLKFRELLRS